MSAGHIKETIVATTVDSKVEAIMAVKHIEIGLRFRIDQIAEIDTVAQTYKVVSVLDMDWEASEVDIQAAHDNAATYIPQIVPRIDPRNVVEKGTDHKAWANGNLNKLVEKDGIFYNLRRIEYDNVWTQSFNVENFPFDVQDLTFVFQSREFNKTQSRIFVPSHFFPTFFRIEETYLAVADWEFKKCDAYVQLIDWRAMVGLPSDQRRIIPRMCFRIQARRRSYPIMMRVVFWMFLLGVLSFFMFSIDPIDDCADRLAYAVTMALALVAFQFVLSEIIPKVPYLTLVDKYNLLIFVLLLLITAESACIGYYGWKAVDSEVLRTIDKIVAVVYLVAFVLVHLYFIWRSKCAVKFEDSKIGMDVHDIHKLLRDSNAPSFREPSVMHYSKEEYQKSSNRIFSVPAVEEDGLYFKSRDDGMFESNVRLQLQSNSL